MRSEDIVLLGALVGAFAIFATSHVCIVFGLASRRPKWRAVVALFIAPLAPYWAIRERMFVRAVAWLGAAVAYVVARAYAS